MVNVGNCSGLFINKVRKMSANSHEGNSFLKKILLVMWGEKSKLNGKFSIGYTLSKRQL